jgi:RHS repeat-associated protein
LSYSGPDWTAPLTDTVIPDADGNWAGQSISDTGSSLVSSQAYTYDNDGRLTHVQDEEGGQCTTRAYSYDVDSNRLSLTSFASNTDGTCQSTTGNTVTSTYDGADRITNSGYIYDTQGDVTTTPSSDAGGSGNLTATYYANDMLESQTQNSNPVSWSLDPTQGRFGSYTEGGVTYVNHYGDSGDAPSWVSGSNGDWIRNVVDFNGDLAAEVTPSGETLELPDLHGDVTAIATTNATATGPTAIYIYTEFGTPETAGPGMYGWLGGHQISGALGGQLLMGARAYNTNTGRFSQVDPVPGGSANSYDYALQNPLTNSDLQGTDVWQYCLDIARFSRVCVGAYDHYASMQLIYSLEAQHELYSQCADRMGDYSSGWAVALYWICQARSVEYRIRADDAKWWLDLCGGEEDWRSGLLVVSSEYRVGWWWWGWHYTSWRTAYSYVGGCW